MKIFPPQATLAMFLRCAAALGLHLAAAGVRGEAASGGGPVKSWPAEAVIQFAGTSTLHDFGGKLAAQPFILVISNGTWFATADVLAGEMKTGSDGRDRKMREMMRAPAHPQIRGSVAPTPLPTTNLLATVIKLKICDTERDLPARVTGWQETPERIQFHADWELSLEEYGLKPPSVLGVIRVGDRVKLSADVIARKDPPKSTVAKPKP